MGNATSSSAGTGISNNGDTATTTTSSTNSRSSSNNESSSNSSSLFRLPLYRGERDAFLLVKNAEAATEGSSNNNCTPQHNPAARINSTTDIIDNVDDDEDEGFLSPPPLSREHHLVGSDRTASVFLPETTNISGTANAKVAITGGDSRVAVGNNNDDASSPLTPSPPSVISSSSSSSDYSSSSHATYGTCVGSEAALLSPATDNGSGGQGEGGEMLYAASSYQHQQQQEEGRHQQVIDLLPKRYHSTGAIVSSNMNMEKSAFDCVKLPKRSSSLSSSSSKQQQQTQQQLRKSSSSLTLLFDNCIKSSSSYDDDDEHEYYSANNHTDYNTIRKRQQQQQHERSLSHCSVQSTTSSNSSVVNNGGGYFFGGSSSVVVAAPPPPPTHPSHKKSNSTSALLPSSSLSASSFHNKFLFEQQHHQQQYYTQSELDMDNGDEPTYESNLYRVRDYHVVTTAALPWMTGTGVNPLLRGGYLLRRNCELKKKQQQEKNREEQEEMKKRRKEVDKQEEEEVEGVFSIDVKEDNEVLPMVSPIKKRNKKKRSSSGSNNDDDDDNGSGSYVNQVSPSSSCSSLDYSCFSLSETAEVNTTATTPADESQLAVEESEQQQEEREGTVTLVIPWLVERSDRDMLYGGNVFDNMEDQEIFIRNWLSKDAGMPMEAKELKILFYPARYHKYYNSIFALGDICNLIPNDTADVCILEEPEHLNWYRAPGSSSWTSKFCHCVGVIHTNYKAYARDHAPAGFLAAPLLAGVNSLVVQANCHKVVKLSGVLQEFVPGGEVVENVHGIREVFLEEGQRRAHAVATTEEEPVPKRGVYFIGKLLWAKGFDLLLELETYFRHKTGEYFDIDIYGSGPDEEEIKRAFNGGLSEEGTSGGILYSFMGTSSRRQPLPVNFMGRLDHSKLAGDDYSIFVNPSLTEVLCTTTAESIAMGKWVVIPSHPSNAFFEQFPNCLMYRSRRGFVTQLKTALENDPPQLSDELAQLLSWDAATMRCVTAAAISKRDAARSQRINQAKEEKTLKKAISGFFTTSLSKEESSSPPSVGNRLNRSKSSPPLAGYGSIDATKSVAVL